MNQIHTPVSTDIPELALNRPVLTLRGQGLGVFPSPAGLGHSPLCAGEKQGKAYPGPPWEAPEAQQGSKSGRGMQK